MSPAPGRGLLDRISGRFDGRGAPPVPPRFAFLLAVDGAEVARAVEDSLRAASIPFESGLQALPEPRIVFSVPEQRVQEAKAVVAQCFGVGPLAADEPGEEERTESRAPFPRGALLACLGLVAVHLVVLAALVGAGAGASRLAEAGGLVSGSGALSLWRLVSYPFVHADLSHVLWNGVALVVFGVPVIDRLGWGRAAAVYGAGAITGGAAALATSLPGTVTVGSSAAIAALFGTWVVLAVRDSSRAPLTRRAAVRAIGIGLLVLPTLLAPTTSGGKSVSVAAHLGGLGAGIFLGLVNREGGTRREPVRAAGSSTGRGGASPRGPRSPA